jgi:hypothetical protein
MIKFALSYSLGFLHHFPTARKAFFTFFLLFIIAARPIENTGHYDGYHSHAQQNSCRNDRRSVKRFNKQE